MWQLKGIHIAVQPLLRLLFPVVNCSYRVTKLFAKPFRKWRRIKHSSRHQRGEHSHQYFLRACMRQVKSMTTAYCSDAKQQPLLKHTAEKPLLMVQDHSSSNVYARDLISLTEVVCRLAHLRPVHHDINSLNPLIQPVQTYHNCKTPCPLRHRSGLPIAARPGFILTNLVVGIAK
jgi:hypothetical protein